MTSAPSQSAPSASREVELVVVAYRSRREIEGLLANLPHDLPITVVDNSDGWDGLEELVRGRPNGRYLAGGGVGFARAANKGARASTADYVVFVNPDVRPRMSDIAAIVEDLAEDPSCAASAAALAGPDGAPVQGIGGWEPTLGRAAVHALGLHKLFPQGGLYARPSANEDPDLDWLCGGCLAVRRETFLELGGFDEDFYVYNEDVALGRVIRERGLRHRLRTDVPIQGSNGGSGAPSLEMMRLRGASMGRYLRKYRSRPVAELTTVVLGAGYSGRALIHRLRGQRVDAQEDWAHALGLFTGRATVASKVVTSR